MTHPQQFGQYPQQQQPQWGPPPQVPPQGAPAGAPPMPPQGGYPGGQPQGFPGGPPPQAPKGNGVVQKVLGLVGTVVVGIIVVVVVALLRTVDGGGIAVGECIDLTNPSTTAPEWETAPCGSPQSDFKVAKQLDGMKSCGSDYDSLTKSGDYTMCMVPDVSVGDCLTAPALDISTKVPCSDPDAAQQVTTAVNNSSGEAACREDSEQYLTWDEPPLTVCVKSV
ncbi:LppU/SCO3897 family protein [Saccharopolyspora hordei]|uniref:Uncharacterized protein n=1 Tax=Saccharopolyspora hordei TaxID=1838 RepID=A0A853ACN0_9PSEU|nr:hypothetical protein [Saccharopolyspora hordei]NYI81606.1 hypothetical protein [Saccharopolyspora hordei]